MSALIVMTVGQTDVQLVVDNQRRKLDNKTCGTLLDEIVKRAWRVVKTPSAKNDEPIKELPSGELTLCTPKLDALLAHFGDELPASALIFETTRQEKAGDPRKAGTIVEEQLLAKGVYPVQRKAYLTNGEELEDSSTEDEAFIRREVVSFISHEIHAVLQGPQAFDHVFVAPTGGLPAVKNLIIDLVRLHAVGGPTVKVLEVPESKSGMDEVVGEKFNPATGYRARWHALSLIQKGNLLGAWGAVSHLEDNRGQEKWTKVIKWLAHFAASLPMPPECDLAILKDQPMAVHAALRVEFALRAGDIPRATHGTVAFFEAALWDELGKRLERAPEPARRRYFKVIKGEKPTESKLLRTGDRPDEDRKCPFELKETLNGVEWYWVYDGDGGPSGRLAEYFLKSTALKELDKTLDTSIRELRNDIAHNEPTPELMSHASERMQERELWSQSQSFISQAIIQAVLVEMGVPDPGNLLSHLLIEVRNRLISAT
jgi:hypothetical protein